MKLYYLTGACSLASYIALIEAGQKFEAIEVDRGSRKGKDGKDLNALNPKGYVPVLELDDGSILTENVAVLTYIATLDPAGRLAPKPGTIGFFRVVEWLAYVSTEVHQKLGVLFRPNSTEDMKQISRDMVMKRYGFIDQSLGDKSFLTGESFTVADAYLYVTLSWLGKLGIDISSLPKLSAYFERCRDRPSVQRARTEEGLPAR